ncbi:MAG: type I restriction enzyme HsdR N-terminal domain-containing protein [Planctomycetes bacterium]|nr:type I restriction enzyme HsdR N-terminal domain-containing protein [Planctomycetota bacterium]
MMGLPKRVAERISAGLKRFQPILTAAKARDVNESDTVVIVTDLLQDVFGYDKYAEITSEHMIRGTFCDLAIKLEGGLTILIEVKAVGHDLKEQYIKQAVDYAANQGCEWVALTNGHLWRVYRVCFSKPIEHELVVELDLLSMNHRSSEHHELIGLLSKEGWQRAHIGEYHTRKQAFNRFTLAAVILSEPIVDALRRELRRIGGNLKVDEVEVRQLLTSEVLKREVIEGEKADAARRQVAKNSTKPLRASRADQSTPTTDSAVDSSPTARVE